MDSLWDINDMLKDWECVTDLLLEEPGRGEERMYIITLSTNIITLSTYIMPPEQSVLVYHRACVSFILLSILSHTVEPRLTIK